MDGIFLFTIIPKKEKKYQIKLFVSHAIIF